MTLQSIVTVIESDLQEDVVIVHTGDTPPSPFICDRTPEAKLEMSFKTPPMERVTTLHMSSTSRLSRLRG